MSRKARVDMMKRHFGDRLRLARIESGYEAAREMAHDLGVAEAAYRKYERGESWPPLDVLEDICRLTSSDPGWLLFGWPRPSRRK